jgi:integrase
MAAIVRWSLVSKLPRPAPRKHKFTDNLIRKLKPLPTRAYAVWDTRQPGLAVVVQPSGHRAFKFVYSFKSRPRWYHIGNAVITVADARRLAAGVMLKVIEGHDPAAEKKAERQGSTFAELAEAYVERYAKKKNRSWPQADKLVRKHLLPRWGKLPANSIARADVKTMMSRMAAPMVANQTLAAASAIFAWAIREDILKINPCQQVERHATASRERILSGSEIPLFWSAFDDVFEGALLKMILLTGQRPGEVRCMRTEHIKDGWWEMPGKPDPAVNWPGTKNGASHRIRLPTAAQTLLVEQDANGFVFEGARGKAIDASKLPKVMRDICSKLKVERATPHDLRRTHGTTVTGLGFGRDAMNRIQNHKEGGVTSVYDRHQYADENKHVMEVVAAHVLALVEGRPVGSNVVAGQFGRQNN